MYKDMICVGPLIPLFFSTVHTTVLHRYGKTTETEGQL